MQNRYLIMKALKGHSKRITITYNSLSLSRDGIMIPTGRFEKIRDDLRGHSHIIICLSFSPNGKKLDTKSNCNTSKV